MCAAEEQRATDLFVDSAKSYLGQFSAESLEFEQSPIWLAKDYEAAVRVCAQDGRPPSDSIWLRMILLLIANGRYVQLLPYADPLIERLRLDIGVVDASALNGGLDPKERIEQGIRVAQERFSFNVGRPERP